MTDVTARRALRRASAVALAFAMIAALSACFPTEPRPQPTATGLATPVSVAPLSPLVVPAVLAYCPLEEAVHFSGYWLPTDKVYICRADGHHDGDGVSTYGPWESASLIAQPASLLKAYRTPNKRAQTGPCDYRFLDPMIVWVHRDGVTSAYYAPVDGCGNPTTAAIDAYRDAERTLLIDFDRGAPASSRKDPNG